MKAISIINDIKEFRKANKKCVSTSHDMSIDEFLTVASRLKKAFGKFTAEFRESDVLVTIPRYKH